MENCKNWTTAVWGFLAFLGHILIRWSYILPSSSKNSKQSSKLARITGGTGGAAITITRPSNWGETHRGLVFPKYLLLSHLLRFSVALILFSSCCCCCCCLPKVICLRCRHCVDCNVRSLENGSSNTRGSQLANTSVHLLFQPSMWLGSAAEKPLHLLSSPLRSRGYQDASFLSPGIGNSFPVATCHCEREMRKLILENAYRQLFQFKMQEEVQNPRMFCPFSLKKKFSNRPEKEGDWAAGDSAGGTIFRKWEQKNTIFFVFWSDIFPAGYLPF